MLLSLTFGLAHRLLLFRGVQSRVLDGVHYYDAPGTGENGTVVLQHGIGAEALHFAPMLPILRRSFSRVILPDLPGHGRSAPAPEMNPETLFTGMAHVLDTAVPEPAVVFGNSLGGAMAVQWASERPGRTRALILASPGGAPMPEEALRAFLTRFDFPDRRAVVRFFQQLNPTVPWTSSLVAAEVGARFRRPHMRALLASIRPQHLFDAERVRGLSAPTLLLWGRKDSLMPAEMRAWYREHLPAGAAFEEPDDVGHCPQVDRPGWTARRILMFVQQVSR